MLYKILKKRLILIMVFFDIIIFIVFVCIVIKCYMLMVRLKEVLKFILDKLLILNCE